VSYRLAVVVGLLLGASASGEPDAGLAADAPLLTLDAGLLDVRVIKKGQPAPADGVFMSNEAAEATARGKLMCEAEREALRNSSQSPPWLQVAAAAAVGVVAGVAIGYSLHKP